MSVANVLTQVSQVGKAPPLSKQAGGVGDALSWLASPYQRAGQYWSDKITGTKPGGGGPGPGAANTPGLVEQGMKLNKMQQEGHAQDMASAVRAARAAKTEQDISSRKQNENAALLRNILMYGGIGLGTGALGAGLYGALRGDEEEEE